jgi:hypothetical protein
MKIISRQEAIEQKLTRYFTGKPCKHGHIAKRTVSNKSCTECHKLHSLKNKSQKQESERKRLALYFKINPHLAAKKRAKYRAAKLNRTPIWLTPDHLEQIEDFYVIAKMFQMYTGELYHVDHIEPLQGKDRSGLHVPWNLQVLPHIENLKKSNKASI